MYISNQSYSFTPQKTFRGQGSDLCFLQKFMRKHSALVDLQRDLSIYLRKNQILESDIKGLAGLGGLSWVFLLGKNEVLKCSRENPVEFRDHNSEFDIPFLSAVEKQGMHYFVREPKAETDNISINDCKRVIDKIYRAGYEPSVDLKEYRVDQVGRYNDVLYLLDTRAAVPQPSKFSQFIYDYCSSMKRVIELKSPDPLDFSIKHVDETPRKNLKFLEGIKMAFDVVDKNVKYEIWNEREKYLHKYYIVVESIVQKIKELF